MELNGIYNFYFKSFLGLTTLNKFGIFYFCTLDLQGLLKIWNIPDVMLPEIKDSSEVYGYCDLEEMHGISNVEFTDENGVLKSGSGSTGIFIYPGYSFRVVDHLITNFHLPQSSLIMLVAALCGRKRILEAYEEAVREKYRFFSYGDAMFVR